MVVAGARTLLGQIPPDDESSLGKLPVKTSPVLLDRTRVNDGSSLENMEVILCDREEPPSAEGKANQIDPECSKLIEARQWMEFCKKLYNLPEGSDFCANYRILHLVCEHMAPYDVIRMVFQMSQRSASEEDSNGNLPLHLACGANGSSNVIQLLLEAYPQGILVANNDMMLPIHIATQNALSEDVLITLMTFTPDAVIVEDAFGRTAIDYARSIECEESRDAVLACLERGPLLKFSSYNYRKEDSSMIRHCLKKTRRLQRKKYKAIIETTNAELVKLRRKSDEHHDKAKRRMEKEMEDFVANTQETIGTSIFAMQQKIEEESQVHERRMAASRKKRAEEIEAMEMTLLTLKEEMKDNREQLESALIRKTKEHEASEIMMQERFTCELADAEKTFKLAMEVASRKHQEQLLLLEKKTSDKDNEISALKDKIKQQDNQLKTLKTEMKHLGANPAMAEEDREVTNRQETDQLKSLAMCYASRCGTLVTRSRSYFFDSLCHLTKNPTVSPFFLEGSTGKFVSGTVSWIGWRRKISENDDNL